MSGEENMRQDIQTLAGVERGEIPPTVRFFRFAEPTVTFGRLQKPKDIAPLSPQGWELVQRPTGGGLVFHQNDLCLSLCWPRGQAPLPQRPQDQYRWIHGVILEAMGSGFRMAPCCDTQPAPTPFATRECFTSPVGYDVLSSDRKVVGGALSCHRQATLYQGAIHIPLTTDAEAQLRAAFENGLRDL